MKKFFIIFISLLSFQSAYAASCVDINISLTKGNESPSVLSLQNFLYGKGILKVKPNGYFGPSTFAAVKLYQKSIGLSQVGNLGPATRASIKKESCSQAATASNPVAQTPQAPVNPVINQQVSAAPSVPAPVISSMDSVTLFAGGVRDWNISIYGTGFSTSTGNSIYFKSRSSFRKYFIGTTTSSDGITLVLPSGLTTKYFSCGNNCSEPLPVGSYDISVVTNGQESNTLFTTIKSFTMSTRTGTENSPLQSNATNALLAQLSFAVGAPVQLISVTPNISTESLGSADLTSTTMKDEMTGATFAVSQAPMVENQSNIIGLYGTLNGSSSGRILTTFTVTIMDYISRKNTTFTGNQVLTTVTAH